MKFSFSKKAEPKRVVEALRTAPKADAGREEIVGLEAGQVSVNVQKEEAKKLSIPCKNPLEDKQPKPKPTGPAVVRPTFDENQGGLSANLAKLSDEDKEAVKELMKAAEGKEEDTGEAIQPILMRAASKRARNEEAPDARKDQFETVPVESFGEALLRGMGYDPSKHKTKAVFNSVQRDTCLGLGAKALLPHEKLGPPAGKKTTAAPAVASAKAAAKAEPGASSTSAETEKRRRIEANEGGAEASTKAVSSVDSGKEKKEADDDVWPVRGLIVRLVSQEPRLKEFFGGIASVLEVDSAKRCCKIKARDKSDKSQVLQDVRIKDLQTRVSRDCKSLLIVRGKSKGKKAKLVKRDVERNVAVIQLEGAETELPLDAVCESML